MAVKGVVIGIEELEAPDEPCVEPDEGRKIVVILD
jgi:hypothetical protein